MTSLNDWEYSPLSSLMTISFLLQMALKSSTPIASIWILPQQGWAGSQHKPPGANITPDKLATRLEKGGSILLLEVHFLSFSREQEVIGMGKKGFP